MRVYTKLLEIFYRASGGVIVFLLGGMTVAISLQVFFRYALDAPLSWSEEVARYFFIWLSLLGASMAVRDGTHINVDVFLRSLPRGAQRWLMRGVVMGTTAFVIPLDWWGIRLMMLSVSQLTAATRVSVAYVYLSVPVSTTLMLLYLVEAILRDLVPPPGGSSAGRRASPPEE